VSNGHYWMTAMSAFVVAYLAKCSTTMDERLPPVKEPRIFSAPVPCVAPPPPPPFQEPVAMPSDPTACFPKAWLRAVPVELSVVDGVVKGVRFYDQCEGKEV
jgi:hypothetical protein